MANGTGVTGRDSTLKFAYGLGKILTKGTASGGTTGASLTTKGATTITLGSAGTGSILAGDVVTFGTSPHQYQVKTGDADVSGGGTLVLQDSHGLREDVPAGAAITIIRHEPIGTDWTSLLVCRSKDDNFAIGKAEGQIDGTPWKTSMTTDMGVVISVEAEINTSEEYGYAELVKFVAYSQSNPDGQARCWASLVCPRTGEETVGVFTFSGLNKKAPNNDMQTFTFELTSDGEVRMSTPVVQ